MTLELNRVADFFDIMNIKQTYPKVMINLLGNFHQAKTIHVLEEGDAISNPSKFDEQFQLAQD